MPSVTPQTLIPGFSYIRRVHQYIAPTTGAITITFYPADVVGGIISSLTPFGGNKNVKWMVIPVPSNSKMSESDTTTDGRKVSLELVKSLWASYAAIPQENKPSTFRVERLTPATLSETTIRQGFSFYFDLDISAADVASE